MEQRLANPQMIEYTMARFQEELQKRLAEIQRQTSGLEEIRRERRQLHTKAQRLTDAIADAGHSPALLSKLGEVEAKIAELDRHMEACKPMDITTTVGEVRDFVYRNLMYLQGLLHDADATTAKAAFSRHIGQLVLKPKQSPSGPIYEVSGGINLTAGEDVMLVVARDGIGTRTAVHST